MKLDPNKIYLSPLIIGPVFEKGKLPGLIYKEIQVLALQYETDPDAAKAGTENTIPHRNPLPVYRQPGQSSQFRQAMRQGPGGTYPGL